MQVLFSVTVYQLCEYYVMVTVCRSLGSMSAKSQEDNGDFDWQARVPEILHHYEKRNWWNSVFVKHEGPVLIFDMIVKG